MTQSAENFRKGILLFLRKFLVPKKLLDEKGYITFSRRNFLVSQCRKKSWASLQCFRSYGVSKNFMHLWGITIFRRRFLSHSAENFCGQPFNVSEKLGYRKISCTYGVSQFSVENFFVSQCRKLLRAFLQCFRKFEVSKKFMHNRGYHNFPSKFFCVTVPKKFVRESYCFWENFWFQKVLWMKKRVSRFCFWNFWSHSAEKFRGQPLNVSEKLGYWKNLCILAGITFSRRNFLVWQCRKNSWASLQSFGKFGVSKFFMHLWVSQFSVENFCLTVPKIFVGGIVYCFISFGFRKSLDRRGSITIFRRSFCLTVPKYFIRENFGVSKNSFIVNLHA